MSKTVGCAKWHEMPQCRQLNCALVWKWCSVKTSPPLQLIWVMHQSIVKRKRTLISNKWELTNSTSMIHGALLFSLHFLWGLSSGRWFVSAMCLAVPGKREKISSSQVTQMKKYKWKKSITPSSYMLLSNFSFSWTDGFDRAHQFHIQPYERQWSYLQGMNLASSLFFLWKKWEV